MRVLVCALLTVTLLLNGDSAAAQSNGVRDVSVTTRSIITLDTRIRHTTMVILPETEEILDVVCGDQDFWIISVAQHIAHIKPAKEGATTNLNLVTTSGAVYSFLLRENANAQTDLKVYVTGEITSQPAAPRFYSPTYVAALQAEISQAHGLAERASREAQEAIAAFRQQYPGTLQFVYRTVDYRKPFFVRAIWHDGQFTYIRSDARELPAVYELADGQPSLVNFEVRHGTYVISKVVERGALVLGKARVVFEQER
jgi:type IV secretion system protein VirB9